MTNVPYDSIQPSCKLRASDFERFWNYSFATARQPVFNSFQEPRKIQLAPPAPTGDGIMDRSKWLPKPCSPWIKPFFSVLAAGARMDLNNSPKRRIPYPAAVSQALREPEPQNHPDLQQLQTANVPLESVKPAGKLLWKRLRLRSNEVFDCLSANGPVFDQSLLSGRPQISPIIPNLPEIKPLDFHNWWWIVKAVYL